MNMQHCLQICAEAFKLYALFLFTVLAVIYMSWAINISVYEKLDITFCCTRFFMFNLVFVLIVFLCCRGVLSDNDT